MVNETPVRALLVFSIGPVQSFIATARRTQDLYVSSALLSYLAQTGVEEAEKVGATLIYPVKTAKGEWPTSIPNRFVLEVAVPAVEQVATAIERAIRREWQFVADSTHNYFAQLAPNAEWQATWARQVNSWLETYWAAWHWTDQESYSLAFQHVGLALDARKRIRSFPAWPEPGEKCTLSGIHEALGPESYHRQELRRFWQAIQKARSITPAELRKGERLSAISIIKRFAAKEEVGIPALMHKRFPSTSSIAAASFRKDLLTHWETLAGYVLAHLDALDALGVQRFSKPEPFPHLEQLVATRSGAERVLRYDGDFFYGETFELQRLKETLGKDPGESKRQHALSTLKSLLAATALLKLAPPHLYLATLVLDGDSMGKLLGACVSPDQHRRISQALANFAETTVRTIVEIDHPGRLVYAGGDDVLALMPARFALTVADQLQRAFSTVMAEALAKEMDTDERLRPTASAGIAISHHIQPLEGALRAARSAEYIAKDAYGRNALVVDVIRRSGEKQRVGIKWSAPEWDIADSLAPIWQTQQLIEAAALSGKVAYDLKAESVGLQGILTALPLELERLFKRHWQNQESAKVPAQVQNVDPGVLAQQWAQLIRLPEVTVDGLAGWLLLARFLAQSGQE
ncbi:MAG: type III-B CRISPR-associated protein Cas10/Cmr2 [Caldilineaceae bacterium]